MAFVRRVEVALRGHAAVSGGGRGQAAHAPRPSPRPPAALPPSGAAEAGGRISYVKWVRLRINDKQMHMGWGVVEHRHTLTPFVEVVERGAPPFELESDDAVDPTA